MLKTIKNLIKILACFLILIIPINGIAQTDVSIHTRSYHTSREYKFNENNLGLLFRHHTDKVKLFNYYTFGAFNNSEDSFSVFAGVGKLWGDDFFKFSISTGLVTGYQKADIIPIIIPTVHIGDLNIHITPDPINSQVVFSFSIKLLEW